MPEGRRGGAGASNGSKDWGAGGVPGRGDGGRPGHDLGRRREAGAGAPVGCMGRDAAGYEGQGRQRVNGPGEAEGGKEVAPKGSRGGAPEGATAGTGAMEGVRGRGAGLGLEQRSQQGRPAFWSSKAAI